jgi:flagellar hook protein FlgE
VPAAAATAAAAVPGAHPRSATGWTMSATDGTNTQAATPMVFGTDNSLTSPTTFTLGGVTVDLSAISGYAGVDTVQKGVQNGREAGVLQSFELGADGTIMGSFSNGLKQAIGRIALANFTNPAGLQKAGGSLFETSVNSGDAQVGVPGAGGRGSLAGGALEMSNVDLSSEFTSLIIAQRGFQANSRVITTSDEVLQELVNLKR